MEEGAIIKLRLEANNQTLETFSVLHKCLPASDSGERTSKEDPGSGREQTVNFISTLNQYSPLLLVPVSPLFAHCSTAPVSKAPSDVVRTCAYIGHPWPSNPHRSQWQWTESDPELVLTSMIITYELWQWPQHQDAALQQQVLSGRLSNLHVRGHFSFT